MTEQQSVNINNQNNTTDGPGALLRQAREAKGLTQQDISNSLRFSIKQIDALENSQFDAFPDAMMARGFIRSYAKYLQIDAEPLLAEFRTGSGDEAQKVIVVKSSMRPVALTKESWPWLHYILATIVVLLFLLAWMFYVEFMPQQAADVSGQTETTIADVQQDNATAADTNQAAAVPEAALPAAERATEADANAAIQDITATSTESATPAPAAAQPALPVPVAAETPAQPAATQANIKVVALSFSGQSWVSATDKSGKVIYEKLSQSGAQETISAVPPISLVIGNASETKLQFAGQSIDLTSYTKNNIARITLE